MRKPVYAICEQQRRSSAGASSLISTFVVRCLHSIIYISNFYIYYFKPLACFCICAGRFVSYLVANPEVFSRDEAHIIPLLAIAEIPTLLQVPVAEQACFESYLVANPENRFSHDEAQLPCSSLPLKYIYPFVFGQNSSISSVDR